MENETEEIKVDGVPETPDLAGKTAQRVKQTC